jgi:hypothetical protein
MDGVLGRHRTLSAGQVGGVGGWLVRLQHGRFQSGCGQNGVPQGCVGAWRCRARVSPHRRLDAVQACVLSGAGRGVVALERAARSARSGRLGGV